jgi:NitT/TauT family transport system substrate-binding protein
MNHFSVATARWVFAGAASLASCALAAPALGTLTLGGPGAVVSYPLMHMVETQALRAHAQNVEFRLWESHDQLSALLVQKKLDFSAAPTTLPALLASKGQNTRLLSVSVWGLVWLVSTDPKVQRFADLGGEELLSPFQHDLGDVLIDTLLTAQAQDGQPAVKVRRTRTRTGQDAIALMLSGQGRHVVLAEPMASMLLWRNQQQSAPRPLHRVQSLEGVWATQFPAQPSLPQAGLMANATVADDRALSEAVEQAYAASARWCKAQALECARIAHKYLPHMPVPVLQQAIEVTRLESRPATAVRAQLQALYTLLQAKHPKAIGNRLPADGFYGP